MRASDFLIAFFTCSRNPLLFFSFAPQCNVFRSLASFRDTFQTEEPCAPQPSSPRRREASPQKPCLRTDAFALSRPTKGSRPGRELRRSPLPETRDRMRLPPLLSGLPARVRHREVECQTAVTAKRKFKAAAHRLAVRLAMPPVDVSSQNLRERSLQVSAPRVPAGGVHGEKNASAHLMCLPRQSTFSAAKTFCCMHAARFVQNTRATTFT